MFLFACPPGSTSVDDNRENAYAVEKADVIRQVCGQTSGRVRVRTEIGQ